MDFKPLLPDLNILISFNEMALSSFWFNVEDENPLLLKKATKILLLLAIIYIYEEAFSNLTNMKAKYGSRLTVDIKPWAQFDGEIQYAMSPHFFLFRFCIWSGFKNKSDVCHVLCKKLFMLDVCQRLYVS